MSIAVGTLDFPALLAVLTFLVIPAFLALSASGEDTDSRNTAGQDAWRQWGGPHHDFSSDTAEIATVWPESGPELLWARELGDGYSSILAENGRLYTMYHRRGVEIAVALYAATGKTMWETSYDAPAPPEMDLDYGPGPHATPALSGDRLFTVGATLRVHAFDKVTGKILWSHDGVRELGAPLQERGFGASPLVYEDLLILTPGGEGSAVVALRQSDGEIVWKTQSFRPSYSSPILADVDGKPQIMVAMGPERAGLDPKTGELLWKATMRGESSNIMSTQVWGEDNILFGSAAYTDGSRALRLAKKNGRYEVEELWFNTRMRVQHSTMVRLGDYVYGSSGDFGPPVLMAIDVLTGEVVLRQRGFSKANLLAVSGKLLILDEDGYLAVGTPGEDTIEIHSRARILDPSAWTVPTLVGTRLYVRNRREIKAFDLSP